MPKFVLTLNSHSLADYQQCPTRYLFTNHLKIQPAETKPAFVRGDLVTRWLAIYYQNKIKHKESRKELLLSPLFWTGRIQKAMRVSTNDAFSLYRVLVSYATNYQNDGWEPLAVEKGFSKILYEDDENLFVYEGRPDLIAKDSTGETMVIDHKTRSMKYQIYEFNNQVLGYLWAGEATVFLYNYLTLTNSPGFERAPFRFSQDQIEDWRENAIDAYFNIKRDIERQKFPKSYQCSSKFGVCEFHRICEQPSSNVKLHVIRSNFKPRNYRSW